MKESVQEMVNEHSDLVVRIAKLNDYIYSDKSNNDNKIEFANKCIQLSAMKKYEEALRARLENQNVIFDGASYFDKYATITIEKPNQENDESNGEGKEDE